jgi:hypothetical protein
MRLEPLYRLRFVYTESWETHLTGKLGAEEQHFFFAEGLARLQHPVDQMQELAHRRSDDDHGPFSAGAQPLGERMHGGIVPHRHHRGHVEGSPSGSYYRFWPVVAGDAPSSPTSAPGA